MTDRCGDPTVPPASGELAPGAPRDPDQLLDSWRAQGASRHDPVHFRFLEALARRAALHDGAVRQWLDRRLERALTEFAARQATGGAAAEPSAPCPPAPTGLAALVRTLNQHAAAGAAPTSAEPGRPATPGPRPATELKAWRLSRNTWTQLNIERQLSRSQAKAPDNPGPFNSHGLVLRSLQVMQDTAPAYLHRFMAHVDALLWLEQTTVALPASGLRREPENRHKPGRAA